MQQLFFDGWVRTHSQGQPTLRLIETPCSVDQLQAQSFEPFELPKGRTLGRGFPVLFTSGYLQVAVEVMGENRRKQENLIPCEGSCRNIIELPLGFQLSKNAFLRSSAIVKADDLTSPYCLVGDDDLELVPVNMRDEQIELDRLFVTDDRAGADDEETVTATPRLGLPTELKIAEILIQPPPKATALDFLLELDEALKGHRDGEFHSEIRKQCDKGVAEEGTIHPDFDVNAGQDGSHRFDTGEDEILRPVGVMYVSRAVEDVEHLACLSNRAEQRIIASLALFLAIESHCGALCTTASADHRAVEVKGQTTQTKPVDCLQDHLPDELSQRTHAVRVSGCQQATDSGYIGQTIQAKKAQHHWIVAVEPYISELPEADQEMDDETENNCGMIVSSAGAQVPEAVTQPVFQVKPLKQKLEEEEPGEGGQLLVLEAQFGDGVGFALDLVSAKLHGERPPWLALVPRQHHCTNLRAAFSTKKKGFWVLPLDVTSSEIPRGGRICSGVPRYGPLRAIEHQIYATGGYSLLL